MNISEATVKYLDWKGTYAQRAAACYGKWIFYFQKLNGDKDINVYTTSDIVKYRNWLEDNYSPYSVKFGIVVIHNFFKFWKMQGEPCLNPGLIKIGKSVPSSHRAITENEFKRMIESITEHTFVALRDRLIISMLWDTGIRVSELSSMNVEQFTKEKRMTNIITKKNLKRRVIVWSEKTHNLLYQYLPLRAVLTQTSPLLVSHCMQGVQRMSVRSVQRIIRYYAKKSGVLDKVTPHSFRHGWAHHRLDQKASLPFIQRGLGHLNPMSTHTYLQYNDQEFEEQAKGYL